MRLSFNMKFYSGLDGILNTQNKLSRAENQLSKQTRILTPADDPAASAKVLSLDQTIHRTEQYQSNSILLQNNLSLQESVLTNMRVSMDRARVLAVASGNGAYETEDREAIALELKNLQIELFDLMNSRNSEGGYIFSGYQDKNQAYTFNQATGLYEFQGDDGQKALQVSSTIALPGNDSGKMVFDNVDARFKTTPATIAAGGATSANVTIYNQSQFDAYYKNNYDGVVPGNNDFSLVLTAPSDYEILRNGAAMVPPVTGAFTPDQAIQFQGMSITVGGAAAVPGQIDFSLQPPEKKNILTTLGDFIAALEDPSISSADFESILSDSIVQITNASANIDSFLSDIGGRVNVLNSVYGTNEDLTINNKSYRADLSEVDYAAALTEITKQEIALQAISTVFTKVSGVSLFDYIR